MKRSGAPRRSIATRTSVDLRIYGLRAKSELAKLGLKNGDPILRIGRWRPYSVGSSDLRPRIFAAAAGSSAGRASAAEPSVL